ncbi:MAG: tetratricopeptide repeat protein [Anaerolineales bacterium]|nr:tetratricopeptide repeat protein [Anaerolineales bacterium]
MSSDENITREKAMVYFEQAYRKQMDGEFGEAILLYKRSLATYPTAEAYTFLGWTYSQIGHIEKAIALCQQAIQTDPDYGNPYNDIGAYLIDQEKWEEAIPWLRKATQATRYETRQFPYMNLGRAFQNLGQYETAVLCFKQALVEEPFYLPAHWALTALLAKMN